MSFNGWQEVTLSDVIEFNPKESIKKGKLSKKVSMDKLDPFLRKINGYEEIEFTSGTKFRNGDTLLARITPCLENGKTAQVSILEKGEVGFGSTEFIVMREKTGKTLNDFIYYLSISDKFRNIAIKSMTGTSGRQRAQKDVIENSVISIPTLDEQKSIAKILSDLDNKIEVNNKINKNLEEMAQTIFKQWFIDFEFPNEDGKPYKSSGGKMVESELGMIPKEWSLFGLGDLFTFKKGKKPKDIVEKQKSETYQKYLTIDVLNQNSELFALADKVIECDDEDILMVMDGASSGNIYTGMSGVVGSTLAKLEVKDSKLKSFIYQLLKYKETDIKSHLTGSAIPHTDKAYISNQKIALPNNISVLKNSLYTFIIIMQKIKINNLETKKLQIMRDTLLPKLMSGEIRVNID